jgi:TonB-linked SusC/RagA family outer membrane protein
MEKIRHLKPKIWQLMQMTVLQFMLVALFSTLANAHPLTGQGILDKTVTLHLEKTRIKQALREIEKQTDARFVYSSNSIQNQQTISLRASNARLGSVLEELLQPFHIGYEVFDTRILLKKKEARKVEGMTLSTSTGQVEDPVRTLRGKVTDDQNQPLPGVNVIEKGTQNGTVTDGEGNFELSVADGEVILVFSYVGYVNQELPVAANQTSVSITMAEDNTALSEVVVIGYGERNKKDLTGAVSTVTAEDIAKSTSMTPELALQGRAAGVFVSTPSGSPFDRPTVRIRGVSTFGYAEPLYVIDGVPIIEGGASSGFAGLQDIRSPINILTLINPNDIESISVLKDASAAAIYGVRASNGVILITTKRGRRGSAKIEVSAQRGTQDIPNTFQMLNTAQYTTLYQEAYANNPNETKNLPKEFNASDPAFLGNRPTNNWQEALINEGALIEDYSVSVSGGSESTTYFLSAGYGQTEGSLIENRLKRYSLANSLTSRIAKRIETGLTYRLAYNEALDNTGTDLAYVATAPPWQPIFDEKGNYAAAVTGKFKPNPDFDLNKLNPGPKFIFDGDPQYLYGPATRGNPFATQQLTSNTFELFRIIGNAYVQVEPLDGLKIRGTLSGDYYFNLRKNWQQYDPTWQFSQTPGNPFSGHDGTAKGSYGERQSRNINLVKEVSVNYNRSFGNHNFDLLFNAMDQEQTWRFTDASSGQVNFLDPNFRGVGNNPPFNGTFTGRIPQVLQGYLGRLSYKFQDRYYLDVTVRRDGSSVFAPGYRWGTFPSFGAAWRISSERFFPENSFINDLKFRGGWGELGNKETTQGFAYLSSVNTSPDYSLGSGNGNGFGTQLQGARLPNFPNFELTWEKVQTTNVGFDAVLFDNRVNFTAEYYNRLTNGIIQQVSLPPNAGIESAADLNIAKVRNRGIELQLGLNQNIGDLNLNASFNITTVDNEVLELYNDNPLGGEGGRIQEGFPLFYLWGYQVGGIFQNQQEIDAWKGRYRDNVGTNDPKPGDIYFNDINGNPEPGTFLNPVPDSVINNNDRVYLGNTIAGHFYGFNIGANFKGFDFSIFFQGIGDVQKYNGARAAGEGMSSTGANQWVTTLDRWRPDAPSTTMPRAVRNDPNANGRFSDRFVEDAGFMRLKNFQIGYTIPSTVFGKTRLIQRLRIFVSGTNMLTFTNWTGIDPENDVVPPTRQLLFGLNGTF